MVVENCPYERDPRVRREAKALQAAGHSVSVICPSDRERKNWPRRIDQVAVYSFPGWPYARGTAGYLIEYATAMMSIATLSVLVLMRHGFDVVHVANPPDAVALMLTLYKAIGKQVIYDQHDLCPELYRAKGFRNRIVSTILQWIETGCFRLANHVITTNESYKTRALLRGRIDDSKVSVVRNGPDLGNLSLREIDQELRNRAPQLLAYAGVISTQDGVDCLCRALHQLRYRFGRKDFYCVVAGDGDSLPDVRCLALELGLADYILFTGWIADSRAYSRLLNTADICLSPEPRNSYNDQSTFVKIMEFMAAGKPIVAFDLGETRISADGSALYARPMDELHFAELLARLMDDAGLRHEMGELGRRRIQEELAWEYSVPKLLKVYEILADAKSQGRRSKLRGNDAQTMTPDSSARVAEYKS